MFAITGITGRVGGELARTLLAQKHQVRAVVRSEAKGRAWDALGCETSIAGIDDAAALTRAFADAEGVFLMTPPNYDPEPDFLDTRRNAEAIRAAIETSRPKKVVFLSTVGAQVTESNLLNNAGITEAMLRTVSVPTAFLRAAWFMENAAWDVDPAKAGVVQSFLQPLDHRIPMVSVVDIARTASQILSEIWDGVRVVELEGPQRYSANELAEALSTALGNPVRNEAVPRDQWEQIFRSQGMKHPMHRMRMLDGFNAGWIDFESRPDKVRKGQITLEEAIQGLVKNGQAGL